MKATVADYETRVYCVRIVTVLGTNYRFISYPHDLAMSNGNVYRSDLGYSPTDLVLETTASSSLWDLEGFFDVAGITRDQLNSGLLDNARVYAFATSWANPVEDEEELSLSFMGKTEVRDGKYTIQCMGLTDALLQAVGRSFGPLCPWTLFDETLDGNTIPYQRSRCTGPRSAPDGPVLADYKVTGTLTGVTSNKVFTDSSRAEAAGYFNYGAVKITSGTNAGLPSMRIKKHTAGGNFELYHAFHYTPDPSDTYEMIPGCNKKKTGQDCVVKYSNGVNYGGFEDMASPEAYNEFGGNG
jgi:hypothetical protein